jgi:hypothetical protein
METTGFRLMTVVVLSMMVLSTVALWHHPI